MHARNLCRAVRKIQKRKCPVVCCTEFDLTMLLYQLIAVSMALLVSLVPTQATPTGPVKDSE